MSEHNHFKFFGRVGQHFEMTAEVKRIREWWVLEGMGRKSKVSRIEYTYEWVIGEYLFRWFTSKSFEDGLYRISGLVKEHRGWYKNLNQTLVWRCKLEKLQDEDGDSFESLLKSGLFTGNDWG